ncbi:hypothetical protein APY04_1931 [Hyphomicrobium sulfonivorans]|uniref:Uncharacterized protein n=1 Tax=Hyphomicrobium sulfonivorans TaxID=121290 RepID=A0A109BEP0_HYPSL|nr:hypothetical protein APY04_1931 [Hyphomicrobium sulfonivorans]
MLAFPARTPLPDAAVLGARAPARSICCAEGAARRFGFS